MWCTSSGSHIEQAYLHDRSILSGLLWPLYFPGKITENMRDRNKQVGSVGLQRPLFVLPQRPRHPAALTVLHALSYLCISVVPGWEI